MAESTGIGWTHHTANFWWGCQRVSPGCEHCYAETLAVVRRKLPVWGPPSTTERQRMKGVWKDVLKWNSSARAEGVRRRVFVSSMADVFEAHPQVAPWRAEALDLLAQCDGLDVQLLTKRPENIRAMVPPAWLESWPAHVWVGTTVEDQRRANERIPHLLGVPAAVRFLSMEPLLEAVDLQVIGSDGQQGYDALAGLWRHDDGEPIDGAPTDGGVQWVIVGGESGSDARLFRIEWARRIVAQCDAAGVAVFVKQLGDRPTSRLPAHERWPGHDRGTGPVQFHGDGFGNYLVRGLSHHGADPSEWPADLRRQSFPVTEGGLWTLPPEVLATVRARWAAARKEVSHG